MSIFSLASQDFLPIPQVSKHVEDILQPLNNLPPHHEIILQHYLVQHA
jgi:hypothetical protein